MNSSWRIFTGLMSSAFFGGGYAWLTLLGNPANALHVSGQTGCLWGLIATLGAVGFMPAVDLLTLRSITPK